MRQPVLLFHSFLLYHNRETHRAKISNVNMQCPIRGVCAAILGCNHIYGQAHGFTNFDGILKTIGLHGMEPGAIQKEIIHDVSIPIPLAIVSDSPRCIEVCPASQGCAVGRRNAQNLAGIGLIAGWGDGAG